MVETTGIERARQARARLIIGSLFFGSASMGLKFVIDNSQSTAYTDGKVIAFNEEFINNLTIEEVEFIICHEVLHCIMLHPLRIQGRNHLRANKAMDYVVNGIGKRARLTMPPNGLYHDKYSSGEMSWEMVYALLKDEEGGGKGKGGQKSDNSDKSDEPNSSNGDEPSNEPPNDGSNWSLGDVREPKGDDGKPLSESGKEQLEQEWKISSSRTLQACKECGAIPSGIERLIEDMMVKKRDLEDILRDFIQKTINGDYTWRRPNKRHIIHDIYLPSIEGEYIPEIVMVMDTSGSIGDEQESYFNAKLNSVLHEFNTKIQVIYCDTKAHDGGEYDNNDLPIKLKPLGGGGTDFRPAFRMVKDKNIEPSCMIYYTDGYCNGFPEEPDYPVLWAIYGKEREVPFGEVVMITPE